MRRALHEQPTQSERDQEAHQKEVPEQLVLACSITYLNSGFVGEVPDCLLRRALLHHDGKQASGVSLPLPQRHLWQVHRSIKTYSNLILFSDRSTYSDASSVSRKSSLSIDTTDVMSPQKAQKPMYEEYFPELFMY